MNTCVQVGGPRSRQEITAITACVNRSRDLYITEITTLSRKRSVKSHTPCTSVLRLQAEQAGATARSSRALEICDTCGSTDAPDVGGNREVGTCSRCSAGRPGQQRISNCDCVWPDRFRSPPGLQSPASVHIWCAAGLHAPCRVPVRMHPSAFTVTGTLTLQNRVPQQGDQARGK